LKRHMLVASMAVIGMALAVAATDVESLIAEADQLYDRWSGDFDYEAYQTDLEAAIGLYQQALLLLPVEDVAEQSNLLVRLSQACFELSEGYLADLDEVKAAHTLGKDYALAALRLDPDFVTAEEESFRAALFGAGDVGAVFWYGNTLGRYLEFHPLTAMMGGMRDIQACFERAVELDPTYMDGAPLRSLGSFYAQVPSFLGGDMEQAETVHQQAMAVSTTFLENKVNWADFVLQPIEDWASLCAALQDVLRLAEDPDTMALWPFYNERALRRARELLDESPCGI
jgi:tetratricopeptide (TPR) repeat protein